MKRDDKLVLDAEIALWWADKKPKTLPDFGLGDALDEYAALRRQLDKMTLATPGTAIINHQKVMLSRIETAMEKVVKACAPVVHAPTKRVLTSGLPVVRNEMKRLSGEHADAEKLLKGLVVPLRRAKARTDFLDRLWQPNLAKAKEALRIGGELEAALKAPPPADEPAWRRRKNTLAKIVMAAGTSLKLDEGMLYVAT